MENIFEYVDRLFSIVRPRKVFYLAIGTLFEAPKMPFLITHFQVPFSDVFHVFVSLLSH